MKEEAPESLRRAQSEIMELRSTTGRLQLELKCALNENELYEYRLAEARCMMRVQSSEQRAALGNEKPHCAATSLVLVQIDLVLDSTVAILRVWILQWDLVAWSPPQYYQLP